MAVSREYAEKYMNFEPSRVLYNDHASQSRSFRTASTHTKSYNGYNNSHTFNNVSTVYNPQSIQTALNMITTPSK